MRSRAIRLVSDREPFERPEKRRTWPGLVHRRRSATPEGEYGHKHHTAEGGGSPEAGRQRPEKMYDPQSTHQADVTALAR